MEDGVDWVRLCTFLGIPLAVLVAVSVYSRRRKPHRTVQREHSALRTARRGMIGMTLLGVISGALGAVGEDYWGETAAISILYALCVVGLAPMRPFAWLSNGLGLAAYPAWDLATGVAGLLAVPATWYLIFLGVGHLLERQRREVKTAR